MIHSDPFSAFGNSVDISYDGNMIIVGAPYSIFITPDDYSFRGRAIICNRNQEQIVQVGDPIISNGEGQRFGHSVAISGDGRVVNIATDVNVGSGNYSRVFAFNGIINNEDILGLENEELRIYPNPANEFLFIDSENISSGYSISTITGVLIQRGLVFNDQLISIDRLKTGIYIIQTHGTNGQLNKAIFSKI